MNFLSKDLHIIVIENFSYRICPLTSHMPSITQILEWQKGKKNIAHRQGYIVIYTYHIFLRCPVLPIIVRWLWHNPNVMSVHTCKMISDCSFAVWMQRKNPNYARNLFLVLFIINKKISCLDNIWWMEPTSQSPLPWDIVCKTETSDKEHLHKEYLVFQSIWCVTSKMLITGMRHASSIHYMTVSVKFWSSIWWSLKARSGAAGSVSSIVHSYLFVKSDRLHRTASL